MAIARFFDRVHAAAGRHLALDRESLAAALGERVVAVHCGPEADDDGSSPRWVAELLVNLLARLYPRLIVTAQAGTRAHLEDLARAINPVIQFVTEDVPAAATVVIGSVAGAPDDALHPRADGWVARLLLQPDAKLWGPPNPYAAAAAAAFAAAEVFRRAFHDRLKAPALAENVHVSLLDFTREAGADRPLVESDVGEVAFLGLGAVCNATLWCIARHPGLTMKGWAVDPERVDLSNLQRYALTVDADEGAAKTGLALRTVAGTRISLEPREMSLEAFADEFPDAFTVPTVCVSVDNVEGRRAAQALLPRLVVNGWTSDGGLGASWHEFDREVACLACLYHPRGASLSPLELVADSLGLERARAAGLWISGEVPNGHDLQVIAKHLGLDEQAIAAWRGKPLPALYTGLVCGAVGIDLQGRGRTEAVPLAHQSALAGILLAAELVKRADPELGALAQAEPLVAWENVLRPPKRWTRPRGREPRCFCGDKDYQDVYRARWR